MKCLNRSYFCSSLMGVQEAKAKKYKCEMCKWRFVRNFTPTLCPYCGKSAVVPVEEVPKAMVVKVER